MCVFQTYTSHFQTHASILRCMCVFCLCLRCVSNVFVCSNLTYTQIFGQICVYFRRIHQIFHASTVIFRRMHLFCDVCASFQNVRAVFQTLLCVLTWHIRWFSDTYVSVSNVYITIPTHVSYFLAHAFILWRMCLFGSHLCCVSNVYVCTKPTHA